MARRTLKVSGLVAARISTTAIAIASTAATMAMISNMKAPLLHFSTIIPRTNGRTTIRHRNASPARYLLPRLHPARLAVAHQAVEMNPDMGGLGGSVGERDGAVERHAGLVVAAKLHQERAAHAEEMKIIRKPLSQRLEHLEGRFRPAHLGHRD